MKYLRPISSLAMLILIIFLTGSCHQSTPVEKELSWEEEFETDLNMLGHRNWILVVDKAFPEQSSAGMKYIYVEQDLLPTLDYILEQVDNSSHVKAIIYQDKELSFVKEEQLKGIEAFRSEADKVLIGHTVNTLLHDDVFGMLNESSSLFKVLVIKTNCALPYTSVFLQLDCSYWGMENEKILRENMLESTPQSSK